MVAKLQRDDRKIRYRVRITCRKQEQLTKSVDTNDY
jgi:hypothetical protein